MIALQLSEDGKTVVNVIVLEHDADPADFDAIAAPHAGIGIGWTLSGGEWVAQVVASTPAEIKAALAAAVQAHVQASARARGYDSAESCASYALSGNPVWAAEAGAFMVWRDAVWASALATLASVEAGTLAVPSVDALIAGLPEIAWPEHVG